MVNSLHTNLRNLAARAAGGEWPTHAELSNQLLRLWRGAEFDAANVPTIDDGPTPERAAPGGQTRTGSDSLAGCSLKRKHAVMKRKGEACSACGYNAPTEEAKA